MAKKSIRWIAAPLAILCGLGPAPAWAGSTPGALRRAPLKAPVAFLPARPGGVFISPSAARLAAPSALAARPELAARAPLLPVALAASAAAARPSVLEQAARYGTELAGRPGAARVSARALGDAFFDGRMRRSESGIEAAGGGSGGGAGVLGAAASPEGDGRLGKLYPRALFLLDIFDGPVSDKTVALLQKVVDAGVHLVFLTWRPQKGPGSAEEVLLGRMKYGRSNPILVASYNGGRIAFHSKAEEPASAEGDAPSADQAPWARSINPFSGEDMKAFARLEAGAAEKLGIAGFAASALPSPERPLTYVLRLSESVPQERVQGLRSRAMRLMNEELREAGSAYRFTEHPSEARALIAQAMPLRFALQRVLAALEHAFPGESLSGDPGKFLLLSDSRKSPRFTSSFPKGAEVQVVRGDADVEKTLREVLGERSSEVVSIRLHDVIQYVNYWEPFQRGADSRAAGGSGSVARGREDSARHRTMMSYVGIVVNKALSWFYEQLRYNRHGSTSRKQLIQQMRRMWYNPFAHNVYVTPPVARLMRSRGWRQASREYSGGAESYLSRYWDREFGANYALAAQRVQDGLVALNTDSSSAVTLDLPSPSTGKLYRIHTRLARVMALETERGLVLTVSVYRTGKIPADDAEPPFDSKVSAMALLQGFCRMGPDGKWHLLSPDGREVAQVWVQREYGPTHKTDVFEDPLRVLSREDASGPRGPMAQEVISGIERLLADEAYMKYIEENEQEVARGGKVAHPKKRIVRTKKRRA